MTAFSYHWRASSQCCLSLAHQRHERGVGARRDAELLQFTQLFGREVEAHLPQQNLDARAPGLAHLGCELFGFLGEVCGVAQRLRVVSVFVVAPQLRDRAREHETRSRVIAIEFQRSAAAAHGILQSFNGCVLLGIIEADQQLARLRGVDGRCLVGRIGEPGNECINVGLHGRVVLGQALLEESLLLGRGLVHVLSLAGWRGFVIHGGRALGFGGRRWRRRCVLDGRPSGFWWRGRCRGNRQHAAWKLLHLARGVARDWFDCGHLPRCRLERGNLPRGRLECRRLARGRLSA